MKPKQHRLCIRTVLIVSILLAPLGGCVSLMLGKDAKESKRMTEQIINCHHDLAMANLTPMKTSSRRLTRMLAYFTHAVILEDQGKHQIVKTLYPHLINNGYPGDADIDKNLPDSLRDLREERRRKIGHAKCL